MMKEKRRRDLLCQDQEEEHTAAEVPAVEAAHMEDSEARAVAHMEVSVDHAVVAVRMEALAVHMEALEAHMGDSEVREADSGAHMVEDGIADRAITAVVVWVDY